MNKQLFQNHIQKNDMYIEIKLKSDRVTKMRKLAVRNKNSQQPKVFYIVEEKSGTIHICDRWKNSTTGWGRYREDSYYFYYDRTTHKKIPWCDIKSVTWQRKHSDGRIYEEKLPKFYWIKHRRPDFITNYPARESNPKAKRIKLVAQKT